MTDTSKAYSEAKVRTQQKQRVETFVPPFKDFFMYVQTAGRTANSADSVQTPHI